MTEPTLEILTIGHSTLSYESFLERLREARVTAVADVRSAPYSRHHPHFNRENLRNELNGDKIAYVFLGAELGGRPRDAFLFRRGVADYEKMAKTDRFTKGLDRIVDGARTYRVAMMCSEHDPLDCHRCLLVGRALAERGISVSHILSNGTRCGQAEIEDRLLRLAGKAGDDFFEPREQRLEIAYRERAMKVAYSERGEGAALGTQAEQSI